MAVELATAYVSLTVETRNIAKEVQAGFDPVQKIADKTGTQAGKRMTGSMGKMFAGLGGLFAGAMAGIGVKDFLGDALAEARESQKVGALTANVIKTTGGAAKVTAEQVGALANSISRKTGVDDEAIQTGSNLLLTFKNVRNEAGAGSDVFNRATQAAVDLSKAGFGSIDGASKMLGKALNDPIKGISALSRAGVTFTDAQKEQIKQMVKSGDVLGAQKIIMAEVESQVGGAAAATATAGDKARVTFDNLKESAGNKLLPIVDTLATKFTTLVDEWQNGTGFGGTLRDVISGIADKVGAFVGWLVKYQDILIPLAAGIGAIIVAMQVWSAITKAYTAIQLALNVVMMANPIGLIILAIMALIAIIVVAYKKNETFRNIVQAVWNGIKNAVLAVVDWFRNTAWPWIKGFIDKNVEAFKWLKDKVMAAWDGLKAGLRATWDWISKNVFDPIKRGVDLVKGAFDTAKTGIKTAWDALQDIAKKPIKFIIETVLNKGLIAGFNWLSGKIGGPHIADIPLPKGFKTGGVLPGYTPGRDVHRFYSATAGTLDLSGGEGILIPQVTRMLGGAAGIKALNNGTHPLLRGQAFAGGGVWDWVKSKASSAFAWVSDKASDVYHAVTNPLDFLKKKIPNIPGGETIVKYGKAVVDKGVGLAVQKAKDLWNSLKKAFDDHGGVPGSGNAARTVSELTAVVKRILPDTVISSGYRPGSITALGNVSQHAKGLAIDIVPHSTSRFDKIKAAFPNAYQLFYSPRDGQTLLRGKPWRMDSVTKRDHWDHIHLSNKQYARGGVIPTFDSGGTLRPGLNLVNNATGADEHLVPAGRNVNVIIPLDDLRSLRTLEDFLDRIDNSRNEFRKAASGRVSG